MDTTSERAASFAGAAVISALTMVDWQISEDVEAAMASAVDTLANSPDHLEVVLHADWIDVAAFAGPLVARRRCFPRVGFETPLVCDGLDDADPTPRLVTASPGPGRMSR